MKQNSQISKEIFSFERQEKCSEKTHKLNHGLICKRKKKINVMPSTILHFPFSERWNSEINYQNCQKINLLMYESNDLTVLFFKWDEEIHFLFNFCQIRIQTLTVSFPEHLQPNKEDHSHAWCSYTWHFYDLVI